MTPDAELPPPPMAPRVPSQLTLHGVTIADSYGWMRDPAEPALAGYLAAERAYYDAHSNRLAGLTGELYREAAGRIADRDEDSVHWQAGGFDYWTRIPAGQQNRQFLRSRSGGAGQPAGTTDQARTTDQPRTANQDGTAEELLLDENVLAAGGGYVDVGMREPSPDQALLAWSADTTGSEIYALRIRDLATGADLPEIIERTYPGIAWSADSRQLFYLVPDELNRPHEVWRHRVRTDPSADVLVLAEPDARFELTLRASRSGGLVVITAASRDTTEVHVIPAADPAAAPACIAPRRPGVEYTIDHARAAPATAGPGGGGPADAGPGGGPGELYIVTNDGAAEYRLMRAPLSAPGRRNWTEVPCAAVSPARADTRLACCDVFAGHLLLTLRRGGAPLLAITDLAGGGVREVPAAMPAGSIRVEHAEAYDAGTVIIAEESLIEPPVWSELDLATGRRRELKRRQVPGYEPSRYLTCQLRATAADGTPIPVTLARRAGTPLDGSAPCLLYGYGAYESCEFPEFDVSLPSLLDRGVVYAIAHVRGGGECGRNWWLAGRLRAKPNTFGDFIAVADWLAGDAAGSRALVDSSRICSRGLSAGGLLQGAVYSRAPGRWRAVVAEVPFVDCVHTMLDPGIPLTVSEWDEWGDPRDPGDFACLLSYSPYENPPPGRRPDLLVTGAVHDPRVLVHEPAKWVARLRETDTAGSRVIFRVELGAGAHTGPSGRLARLSYEAEVQAFVLDAMGLAGGSPAQRPGT
jgi:oligopeptidase B